MDPMETARSRADAIWAGERAAKELGIALEDVGPGRARMSLAVEPRHTQMLGICHGGVIFTLADACFAFACNSHGADAVAQHNTISFLASARPGDRLTAEARELFQGGRSGLYDVSVRNQRGELVAEMRGASRRVGAPPAAEGATEKRKEETP